jgi:hypothetical protein
MRCWPLYAWMVKLCSRRAVAELQIHVPRKFCLCIGSETVDQDSDKSLGAYVHDDLDAPDQKSQLTVV